VKQQQQTYWRAESLGRTCYILTQHFVFAGAVGGYLAYIGWFCVQAGTSLAISAPLDTVTDVWHGLLADNEGRGLLLAAPALLAGLVLAVVARCVSHGAALPTAMVAIPLLFYIVLFLSGCSMEDARDFGWVGPVSSSLAATTTMLAEQQQQQATTTISVWTQLDLSLVHWGLITELLWTWVGIWANPSTPTKN
jgi:hypothetical protein